MWRLTDESLEQMSGHIGGCVCVVSVISLVLSPDLPGPSYTPSELESRCIIHRIDFSLIYHLPCWCITSREPSTRAETTMGPFLLGLGYIVPIGAYGEHVCVLQIVGSFDRHVFTPMCMLIGIRGVQAEPTQQVRRRCAGGA